MERLGKKFLKYTNLREKGRLVRMLKKRRKKLTNNQSFFSNIYLQHLFTIHLQPLFSKKPAKNTLASTSIFCLKVQSKETEEATLWP